MSGNSIVRFATRFAPRGPNRPTAPMDATDLLPLEDEEDLEVLAKMIEEARNQKVIAEAEAQRAEGRRIESLEMLNNLITLYEAVVSKRGLLCRK
jgi:hypothetical protein